MQVATTSIVGTNARLSWAAPASNGQSITAYEVVIQHSDGTTFSTETSACDGSSAAIVTATQCDIPLTTLIASPFSLLRGGLVQVKARAANAQGFGPYSQVNADGALVETVPAQVQGLTFDVAVSSASQITISWTQLTTAAQTGGSAILSY